MKQKVVIYGEEKFLIQTFKATQGAKYLRRIVRVVGPGLLKGLFGSDMVEGLVPDQTTDDIEALNLDNAIDTLFTKFEDDTVEALCFDLLGSTFVDKTTKPVADNEFEVFEARFDLMFKVIKDVLLMNYGSLFPQGIVSLNGPRPVQAAEASQEDLDQSSD